MPNTVMHNILDNMTIIYSILGIIILICLVCLFILIRRRTSARIRNNTIYINPMQIEEKII